MSAVSQGKICVNGCDNALKKIEKSNQTNELLKKLFACAAVMCALLMLDGLMQASSLSLFSVRMDAKPALIIAGALYMALLVVIYRLIPDKTLIARDGCHLFRESMAHAVLALVLQAGMLKFYELAIGQKLTSSNQTSLVAGMKHDLFPIVICAVAIAPLMEELIFRLVPSLFFADLWRTAGGCMLVMSVTGALFSLSHAPDNALVFSVYFVTGIVFGHACRRGGYACSSLAHFFYNFASVALALSTVS